MADKKSAAPKATGGSSKTECPVTKAEFLEGAKPITVKIGDQLLVGTPKAFSTGSFGWYCGGASVVEVDGVPCKVQVGCNIIVANSKDASES